MKEKNISYLLLYLFEKKNNAKNHSERKIKENKETQIIGL